MNGADIYEAMSWLCWRLKPRTKCYSLEYLDAMAAKQLAVFAQLPRASQAVTDQATAELSRPSEKEGDTDRACIAFCKKIILEADEQTFLAILQRDPRKIPLWRKHWKAIRAVRSK